MKTEKRKLNYSISKAPFTMFMKNPMGLSSAIFGEQRSVTYFNRNQRYIIFINVSVTIFPHFGEKGNKYEQIPLLNKIISFCSLVQYVWQIFINRLHSFHQAHHFNSIKLSYSMVTSVQEISQRNCQYTVVDGIFPLLDKHLSFV